MYLMHINKDQRGLLYRNGDFVRMLRPGWRLRWPLPGSRVSILDTYEPFPAERNLSLFLEDRQLAEELEVVEVHDGELILHYVDDRFREVLSPGRYAFWKVLERHRFVTVNRERPEITAETVEPAVLELPAVKSYVREHRVEAYEKGLLFYDGVFERLLEPGVYRFWVGPAKAEVRVVDLRSQQLELTGQELMTKDKVTLRLNFVAQFRIVDALKLAVDVRDYLHQLYVVLQMILREYVGSLLLDELLAKKEEINRFVLERFQVRARDLGVEAMHAGVKDVILPGEVKEILNLVLIAEKKAQANLITRREETASTRSLLNTARMMDDNPTLHRLKELEFLERVSEKIGNVTLTGRGSLLDHLSGIVTERSKDVPG